MKREEQVQQSLQHITEAGIQIQVFNITLQAVQNYLYHLEVGANIMRLCLLNLFEEEL